MPPKGTVNVSSASLSPPLERRYSAVNRLASNRPPATGSERRLSVIRAPSIFTLSDAALNIGIKTYMPSFISAAASARRGSNINPVCKNIIIAAAKHAHTLFFIIPSANIVTEYAVSVNKRNENSGRQCNPEFSC